MATHTKITKQKATTPPSAPLLKKEGNSSNISKDILIADLVKAHPEVVEMLTYEWGFHCVNCIVSNFETLEQGAATHGILGEDFDIMLEMVNAMIDSKS